MSSKEKDTVIERVLTKQDQMMEIQFMREELAPLIQAMLSNTFIDSDELIKDNKDPDGKQNVTQQSTPATEWGLKAVSVGDCIVETEMIQCTTLEDWASVLKENDAMSLDKAEIFFNKMLLSYKGSSIVVLKPSLTTKEIVNMHQVTTETFLQIATGLQDSGLWKNLIIKLPGNRRNGTVTLADKVIHYEIPIDDATSKAKIIRSKRHVIRTHATSFEDGMMEGTDEIKTIMVRDKILMPNVQLTQEILSQELEPGEIALLSGLTAFAISHGERYEIKLATINQMSEPPLGFTANLTVVMNMLQFGLGFSADNIMSVVNKEKSIHPNSLVDSSSQPVVLTDGTRSQLSLGHEQQPIKREVAHTVPKTIQAKISKSWLLLLGLRFISVGDDINALYLNAHTNKQYDMGKDESVDTTIAPIIRANQEKLLCDQSNPNFLGLHPKDFTPQELAKEPIITSTSVANSQVRLPNTQSAEEALDRIVSTCIDIIEKESTAEEEEMKTALVTFRHVKDLINSGKTVCLLDVTYWAQSTNLTAMELAVSKQVPNIDETNQFVDVIQPNGDCLVLCKKPARIFLSKENKFENYDTSLYTSWVGAPIEVCQLRKDLSHKPSNFIFTFLGKDYHIGLDMPKFKTSKMIIQWSSCSGRQLQKEITLATGIDWAKGTTIIPIREHYDAKSNIVGMSVDVDFSLKGKKAIQNVISLVRRTNVVKVDCGKSPFDGESMWYCIWIENGILWMVCSLNFPVLCQRSKSHISPSLRHAVLNEVVPMSDLYQNLFYQELMTNRKLHPNEWPLCPMAFAKQVFDRPNCRVAAAIQDELTDHLIYITTTGDMVHSYEGSLIEIDSRASNMVFAVDVKTEPCTGIQRVKQAFTTMGSSTSKPSAHIKLHSSNFITEANVTSMLSNPSGLMWPQAITEGWFSQLVNLGMAKLDTIGSWLENFLFLPISMKHSRYTRLSIVHMEEKPVRELKARSLQLPKLEYFKSEASGKPMDVLFTLKAEGYDELQINLTASNIWDCAHAGTQVAIECLDPALLCMYPNLRPDELQQVDAALCDAYQPCAENETDNSVDVHECNEKTQAFATEGEVNGRKTQEHKSRGKEKRDTEGKTHSSNDNTFVINEPKSAYKSEDPPTVAQQEQATETADGNGHPTHLEDLKPTLVLSSIKFSQCGNGNVDNNSPPMIKRGSKIELSQIISSLGGSDEKAFPLGVCMLGQQEFVCVAISAPRDMRLWYYFYGPNPEDKSFDHLYGPGLSEAFKARQLYIQNQCLGKPYNKKGNVEVNVTTPLGRQTIIMWELAIELKTSSSDRLAYYRFLQKPLYKDEGLIPLIISGSHVICGSALCNIPGFRLLGLIGQQLVKLRERDLSSKEMAKAKFSKFKFLARNGKEYDDYYIKSEQTWLASGDNTKYRSLLFLLREYQEFLVLNERFSDTIELLKATTFTSLDDIATPGLTRCIIARGKGNFQIDLDTNVCKRLLVWRSTLGRKAYLTKLIDANQGTFSEELHIPTHDQVEITHKVKELGVDDIDTFEQLCKSLQVDVPSSASIGPWNDMVQPLVIYRMSLTPKITTDSTRKLRSGLGADQVVDDLIDLKCCVSDTLEPQGNGILESYQDVPVNAEEEDPRSDVLNQLSDLWLQEQIDSDAVPIEAQLNSDQVMEQLACHSIDPAYHEPFDHKAWATTPNRLVSVDVEESQSSASESRANVVTIKEMLTQANKLAAEEEEKSKTKAKTYATLQDALKQMLGYESSVKQLNALVKQSASFLVRGAYQRLVRCYPSRVPRMSIFEGTNFGDLKLPTGATVKMIYTRSHVNRDIDMSELNTFDSYGLLAGISTMRRNYNLTSAPRLAFANFRNVKGRSLVYEYPTDKNKRNLLARDVYESNCWCSVARAPHDFFGYVITLNPLWFIFPCILIERGCKSSVINTSIFQLYKMFYFVISRFNDFCKKEGNATRSLGQGQSQRQKVGESNSRFRVLPLIWSSLLVSTDDTIQVNIHYACLSALWMFKNIQLNLQDSHKIPPNFDDKVTQRFPKCPELKRVGKDYLLENSIRMFRYCYDQRKGMPTQSIKLNSLLHPESLPTIPTSGVSIMDSIQLASEILSISDPTLIGSTIDKFTTKLFIRLVGERM